MRCEGKSRKQKVESGKGPGTRKRSPLRGLQCTANIVAHGGGGVFSGAISGKQFRCHLT